MVMLWKTYQEKKNMSLCNQAASGKEIFSVSKSSEGRVMYQLSTHKRCMWYREDLPVSLISTLAS